jgi:hypothetical protein
MSLSIAIYSLLFVLILTASKTDMQLLKTIHQSQLQKVLAFIKTNTCQHIYLDFGTNIGVQIRKLYQPEAYKGAPILPIFDEYFGNRSRSRVCAIGFEANAIHTDRLIQIQESYRNAGYPAVIFTNTAVYDSNEEISFFADKKAKGNHEWGASIFDWQSQNDSDVAIAMDSSKFVHHIYTLWKQSSNNTNENKIVAKFDIEGSEYKVLPHMLAHGSLCLIDLALIEWHAKFAKIKENVGSMISWITTHAKGCRLKMSDLDDESFMHDVGDLKFPPPLVDSKTYPFTTISVA